MRSAVLSAGIYFGRSAMILVMADDLNDCDALAWSEHQADLLRCLAREKGE
jgi:hypothetical protein